MTRTISLAIAVASLAAAQPVIAQRGDAGRSGQQVAPPAGGVQSQPRLPVSRSPLEVQTFPLQHLRASDAAKLVAPYMQWWNTSVFDAGSGIHAITVRAPRATLATVDSLLRAYDRAPVTLVIQFKLIAAVDSVILDPAIGEIVTTLKSMFRFGGYRQLTQTSAVVNENATYDMNFEHGGSSYMLSGLLGPSSGAGANLSQQLTVRFSGLFPVSGFGASGSVGGGSQWRSIVSTGLTVPIGQTVVVGGTAGDGGGRSLILAIRADLAPGKR